MSIKASFYITGDTQQSGFRRIGGSEAFPADQLPYLNNGEPIQERARVESGSSWNGGSGIQLLSHVWEYQTGRYGCPVIINTMVAISTGRAHGFSEYIAGDTDNVAKLADVDAMIAGAEAFELMGIEEFMAIPGRETKELEDGKWETDYHPEFKTTFNSGVDDEWKKTILTHYWKQASIRAFSEDSPTTVRVNLGELDPNNPLADIEATIREAKKFFIGVITPGLPKQVQNIASFAAGVNCADRSTLYTALEFDISQNMYAEETLQLRDQSFKRGYKLKEAELDFITVVSGGKTPEVVQQFFNRYKELTGKTEITELEVPFMADYRVWYTLYCMDRVVKEGHAFIQKAGLMKEHGNPKDISDARAAYLLIQQFRKLLEKDHRLNEERRTLVTELTEPLELDLLKYMQESMKPDNAEPFLLRRNEMVEFHRRLLYFAPDSEQELLIALAVRDAEVSKAPQFVRCYPETPIRNEAADERNGRLLAALLPATLRKRIDEEKKKETVEDKYIDQLRSEAFADNWACLSHCVKTKEAVADFLREEIRDPQKHFLLYKISLKFIPENELLNVTLNHFIEKNTKQNMKPEERQLRIAAHGAREYISNPGSVDSECVSAMNRYYQACFREYRANIGSISEDIIRRLGGDTTEAMTLIFDEYKTGNPLNKDEATAVFEAFGGEKKTLAKRETVAAVYTDMLSEQRTTMLADPDADRGRVIRWLGGMVEAAPFEIDTSGDMVALFNHAAAGERMTSEEAENIFTLLDPNHQYAQGEAVPAAYASMIQAHQARILQSDAQDQESARESLITWVSNMVELAPFRVDTSDTVRALFESARTGERLSRASAQEIFSRLMKFSSSGDEKVKPAFQAMIRDQLDASLKKKDDSVLEWIGGMISASDKVIEFDTTETLKKIFEAAREGDRMQPSDAGNVFATMKDKADGLGTTVRRAYNEMLSVRRKEAVEQADPDGFIWLCDMADRSPWAADHDWIAEQHTENITALCEISQKTETPIDSVSLTTVQSWLNLGFITQKGISQLQKYCNIQLEKGNNVPADAMVRKFNRIDESCDGLRRSVFEGAVTRFRDGLEKPNVSLGNLIEENRPNVEKAGKRLDDLYNETKEQSDEFIERHFTNTSDLDILASEQEQIPENCAFYRIWQEKLSSKVYDQQVDMFNQQPNLEKLKSLKESILKRSKTLQPSLEAAYNLIDSYEGRLEKLRDRNEYEAVTTIGTELREVNGLLKRAADVRKTLCSSLRTVRYPVQEEIREMDFRHVLCADVMQALLTDTSREATGPDGQKADGCPDWKKVLDDLFPQAKLDEAIRKPYAAENLNVLQRLLSVVENARIMAAYGMNSVWVADLVKTIHGHSNLHRYQSALGRNRKMREMYHLKFDTDGLVFDLENP